MSIARSRFLRPSGQWSTPSGTSWTAGDARSQSRLTHQQARFAALALHPESDETAQAKWAKRKAEVVEAIEQFEKELTDVNDQLKKTSSHLKWDELPETEKFERSLPA